MSFHEQHPYTRYDRLIEAYERLGLRKVRTGNHATSTPRSSRFPKDETEFPERPPVLIAAGAHAEEAAGVIAAWRMAGSPGFPGRMLFVPCRDPLGWDGISAPSAGSSASRSCKIEATGTPSGVPGAWGSDLGSRWAGDRGRRALGFLEPRPEHPGNGIRASISRRTCPGILSSWTC